MLLTLAVILFAAWLLGFIGFQVTAGAIHLLLIIAVIAAIAHLVGSRQPKTLV